MENKIYLNNLLNQFNDATGSNLTDVNSLEFIKWKNRRLMQGYTYTRLLSYMGVLFDDYSCAEIGKGREDSAFLSYDTSIISPYIDNPLCYEKEGKIIVSDFEVVCSVPSLVKYRDGKIIDFTVVPVEDIKNFMTQNPYNDDCIKDWWQLHIGDYNGITFGVFGNIYDKDKDKKIKLLNNLKEKMIDCYVECSDYIGDQYFHVVATDMDKKYSRIKKYK